MRIQSLFAGPAAPAIAAFTGTAAVMGDPYDHMDGWGIGWWIWMPIMMVLVWGGIIAVIVWVIRSSTGGDRSERASPLDIAKERLARGEISEEEFERIRQKL